MRERQTEERWRGNVKARLQPTLNHGLKHGTMQSLSFIYWGSSAFSTQLNVGGQEGQDEENS